MPPGIYLCVKDDGNKVVKPVDLFSSVRVLLGKEALPQNIAQILYDLQPSQHANYIRLELETGGRWLEDYAGYANWFPGSRTFGFADITDITVYQDEECTTPMVDEHGNIVLIPVYAGSTTKEEATFQILDVLDAITTDPV